MQKECELAASFDTTVTFKKKNLISKQFFFLPLPKLHPSILTPPYKSAGIHGLAQKINRFWLLGNYNLLVIY